MLCGRLLGGYAILLVHPAAKVQQFAAFRAEGAERVVLPMGRLSAGWTLHETDSRAGRGSICHNRRFKRCLAFDQNAAINEFNRTFATHCIQAHCYAFSC